ncbi:MAG TPA: hypothetical protein VEJ67_14425 [Candidatus Cybelea sp.]|nr:hypothetical protein [Candidatus Cybelea sp.]
MTKQPTRDCWLHRPRGLKAFGWYLLCTSIYLLSFVVWTQIHQTVGRSLLEFQFGFTWIVEWLLDRQSLVLRYAEALWFLGFGILFLRGKEPLKTYLLSQLPHGLIAFIFLSEIPGALANLVLENGQDTGNSHLLSSGERAIGWTIFVIFTAIPLIWAAILEWLRHRTERQRRLSFLPVRGTKHLGYYLLVVALYQVCYPLLVFSLAGWHERTSGFTFTDLGATHVTMLLPRIGLFFFYSLISDQGLSLRKPEYYAAAVWILEVAFAVAMICGRKPLKTYIASESVLGVPGLIVAGVFLASRLVAADLGLADRLAMFAVWLFETGVPFGWACKLLWMGRRSREGKDLFRDPQRAIG